MSKRLFTSDWHLGHKVITKYRSQFNSIEEHDQAIFDQLSILKKRDIVFVLGDILFDCPNYDYYVETLAKMSCRLKFILGNHDSVKLYRENRWDNVEILPPLVSYKNMWLQHAPLHPDEIRGKDLMIHGHIHNNIIPDNRYYNVILDKNDNKFVEFESLIERIEQNKRRK